MGYDMLCNKTNILPCLQSRGCTLLRYSVWCKNKELIDLCLEYGANINDVDEKNGSLLHMAIQKPEEEQEKAFDTLAFLLERGKSFASSKLLILEVVLLAV